MHQNQCPLLDKLLEEKLLKSSLDPQSIQSKPVPLELVTETEASEAILIYSCEFAPLLMGTNVSLPLKSQFDAVVKLGDCQFHFLP